MNEVRFFYSHAYLVNRSDHVGGIEVFYEELRALRRLIDRSPHVSLETRHDMVRDGYEITIKDWRV